MKHAVWGLGGAVAVLFLLLAGLAGRPGAHAAGPARPALPGDVVPLAEGFEAGVLDYSALASAVPTCMPGGCGWSATTSAAHGGTHAAFAPDVAGIADQQLVLQSGLAIPAGATSVRLSFWQRYEFESTAATAYDGGVFEISTDGGTSWFDGGANITAGGYNRTAFVATNPLAGRPGWSGSTSMAFVPVQVNLLSYARQPLLFRFRLGTDQSVGSGGWWIDDVTLTYNAPAPCSTAGWTQPDSYPLPVGGLAVAAQGGYLYAFGGLSSNSAYANAYKYNPATHTSTPIRALPGPAGGASAVSDGTYIYIVNGSNGGGNATAALLRYDPAADSYTALALPSTPTQFQAAVYLAGKIYRIGGSLTGGGETASVEAYTVAGNTWANVTAHPVALAGLSAIALGGYIYTAGGTANGVALASTYRYDPVAHTWDDAAIADLPGPRFGAAADLYNGRWILAGGGVAPASALASAVAWDPVAGTWTSLAQMPQAVAYPAGATAGGAFHALGGLLHAIGVDYDQQYSELPCPTSTPPATTTLPPAATATPPGATSTPPGATATPCVISFADVPPSAYFATPVQYLACHGVISGYGDGTFRPYNNTTRSQMVKIVVLGFARPIVTPAAGGHTFADVPPANPFFAVIETAAAGGLISGYGCGGPGEMCDGANRPYFRPYANVTRGQLSKIAVSGAGYALKNPAAGTFADVLAGTAFYPFVETAACHGLISGYACGGPGEVCDGTNRPYFRQGNQATRGQIAKIVYLAVTGGGACAP